MPPITRSQIKKSPTEHPTTSNSLINDQDQSPTLQNLSTSFNSLSLTDIQTTEEQTQVNIMESDHNVLPPRVSYNKDLSKLMNCNIPRFDHTSNSNPANELRAFIKTRRLTTICHVHSQKFA